MAWEPRGLVTRISRPITAIFTAAPASAFTKMATSSAPIMAVHFEKLLSAVIALGITGIFAAAEFLLLHAPDVAISEAAVGAALTPLIFIVTLRKVKGGDGK